MSTKDGSRANSTDVIGKVFVARSHGLRQCLVCGELFTRTTARAHAEVNCYPAVEFCFNIGGNNENLRQWRQTDRQDRPVLLQGQVGHCP